MGYSIRVGDYPYGIAFDPVNELLYVTNFGSNNISVINTTTNQVAAWIPMPYGIGPLAVDAVSGVVYVGDAVLTVYGISPSTNRIEWTIPLVGAGCPYGCAPDAQTYDSANGDIYVTDIGNNNVSVIRGSEAVAWVPVGSGPNGAAYDSANGDIYVSNEGSSLSSTNLTVIDGTTNRVVGDVPGSGGGPGVAFDSLNDDVFVCQNGIQSNSSNVVTVVNGTANRVVASIPIGSSCGAAVYDPSDDYVYITDTNRPGGQYLSNVTLVDPVTNQIVLTLPVELGPIGIAYDSANQNICAANSESGTVSILPQIYRLTLHETGLPAGTNWSATVGGTTFSSTTSTIAFPEPNGTSNFTIGREANLSASPSSGVVTVDGGPRWVNVTFSKGGGSGLFGLPGATGYYALVGIGAVAAILIAVVVILSRRSKRDTTPGPPSPPPSPPTTENRPP